MTSLTRGASRRCTCAARPWTARNRRSNTRAVTSATQVVQAADLAAGAHAAAGSRGKPWVDAMAGSPSKFVLPIAMACAAVFTAVGQAAVGGDFAGLVDI